MERRYVNLLNKYRQTKMRPVLLSVLFNICIIGAKNNYFRAKGKSGNVYFIETEGGVWILDTNNCQNIAQSYSTWVGYIIGGNIYFDTNGIQNIQTKLEEILHIFSNNEDWGSFNTGQ